MKAMIPLCILLLFLYACSGNDHLSDQGPCIDMHDNYIPPGCDIPSIEEKDDSGKKVGRNITKYVFEELEESQVIAFNQTLPVVAIHISENSREEWEFDQEFYMQGLEYFEAYTALEEILTSHKIPFIEISDEELEKGMLMIDKDTVRYPILFSFNNEVISEVGIARLKEYVSNSGNVFFTYNSFTRIRGQPEPSPERCFVIEELGLRCAYPIDKNIIYSDMLVKEKDHEIISHIPSGELAWRMCLYRMTPYHSFLVMADDDIEADIDILMTSKLRDRRWSFENFIEGISGIITYNHNKIETVNTAIIRYGKGNFIYNSQVNMLWGRYQGEPAIPGALIVLNSIRWSFEEAEVPLVEIKPWGKYDAAFMLRFDVEVDRPTFLDMFKKMLVVLGENNETGVFYIVADQGIKGTEIYDPDFDFVDITDPVISFLLNAAKKSGHVIASHSTWHVGPDFEKDQQAIYNINNSLDLFEQVIGERPDEWTAPAFGANFDSSLQILEMLNITTTGDQKIGYLPHFALSPEREGYHYSFLEIPTSDFYHDGFEDAKALATILEHHTPESIEALVDYYYELGGIINLYAHFKQGNDEKLEHLLRSVNSKENVWHTTPDELYEYWNLRDSFGYEQIHVSKNNLIFNISNTNSKRNSGVLRITLPKEKVIAFVDIDGALDSDVILQKGYADVFISLGSNKNALIEIGFKELKKK